MKKFHLAGLALLFAATGGLSLAATSAQGVDRENPRLVGYGCGPTEETQYADEEDQFPEPCARIQRVGDPEPVVLYLTEYELSAVQGRIQFHYGDCGMLQAAGREGYVTYQRAVCKE